MPVGDNCWKKYAEKLRTEMFSDKCFEKTIPIETVHVQSNTDELLDDLRQPSWWNAVVRVDDHARTLPDAGILVDYELNNQGNVEYVKFRLDERRRESLQGFIDRDMK